MIKWRGIFGLLESAFGQFSDTSMDSTERRGSWGATLLLVSQVPAWTLSLSVAAVLWGITLGVVNAKALNLLKAVINWPVVVLTLAPAVIGLVCHILRKKDDRQAMLELGQMVVQLRGANPPTTGPIVSALEAQLSNAVSTVTKSTVDVSKLHSPTSVTEESGRT